jgi:molybdopterin synthase sulfur carrier subunit
MPSVLIPTPLRKLTNELDTVESDGATVGEVINNLDKAFPGIRERICDEKGVIRRFVNVFVNGEDVRFLEESATPVAPKDEISIVPAIAGG